MAASVGFAGIVAVPASAANNPGTGDSGFFTFRPADGIGGTQINVASGNALIRTRDLADGPLTYHVVMDRFYNSLDAESYTILSPRWAFGVGPDTTLTVESNQDATVRGPSGYRIRFARQADGSYVAPEGFDGSLVRTASGWTLSRASVGDEFGFDGSGNLAWTKDSELRDFTVQGTSAAGRTILSSYGTSSGRRVNLSYTTSGDYFVRLMDDPASGHHWYRYTSGRLSEYESPTGAITTYSYDANGFLDEIVEPGGTKVELDVLSSGKINAITTTLPGGVPQTTSFVYTRRTYKSDVTAPDTTRRTYAYDDDWRVTRDYDPDVVPTVTASGELRDLADGYVGPNRTYPLTVTADQPDGAGLRRLLVERSNGTEIEGEDVPCTTTPFDLVCPTSRTMDLDVSFANVPEGERAIRAAADDDEEHHATSGSWNVLVDKTAPPTPEDLRLQYFDPTETPQAIATLTWTAPDDPNLAGGRPGSGIDRTEVRYRLDNGPMTSWESSLEDTVDVVGAPVGTVVALEARSIDNVGNVSPVATATITLAEQLEDPEMLEAGAEAHVAEFGGSMAAAVQWMERQTKFASLNDDDVNAAVAAAAPGAYGGIWMNNADRRVGIQVTTTAAREAVEDLVDGWGVASFTDVTVVNSTQGQLDATLSDFDTSLGDLLDDGLVMTARDTEHNAVLVEVSDDVSTTQEAQIQAAAASSPVAVRIVPTGLGALRVEKAGCSNINCDGPMRGGVRLRSINVVDEQICTAGFVARELFSPQRHVITAGHCFPSAPSTAWWKLDADGGGPDYIGTQGTHHDDYFGDVGLIQLQGVHQSTALNAILRTSTSGDKRYPRYRIRKSSYLQEGKMICVQGVTTKKTVCARNIKLRQSVANVRAFGGIRTCIKHGDSGGPIFTGGKAIGITSSFIVPEGGGPCVFSIYTGARTAEQRLGVRISG